MDEPAYEPYAWTLNSGRARGGPYNTRQIHHHGPVYRLAVLVSGDSLKALPAQCGPTKDLPDVLFGSYVWQPALEEWFWDRRSITPSRETAKPVNKQNSEETL